MKFVLGEYLERLRAIEVLKDGGNPGMVPNYTELAEEAGLVYQTVSRLVNNHHSRLDLETMGKVIKALRKRGFDTKVSDLLIYEENGGGKVMPAHILNESGV